jgi:hypothetical protein
MKAIDLRVREEMLALAQALCMQRTLERAALLREALEVGLLLLAASGPPAADASLCANILLDRLPSVNPLQRGR